MKSFWNINIDKYYDAKELLLFIRLIKITRNLKLQINQILSESCCQKQPLDAFCEKKFSKKIHKFYLKTPAWSLF